MSERINAEVIAVYPNRIKISVDKLEDFKIAEESLKVGSYLRIADNDDSVLIALVDSFSIEVNDKGERKHIIEANPLGMLKGTEFIRGGDSVAIPPKTVNPATKTDIKNIYEKSLKAEEAYVFSALASMPEVRVPVNGNKFFNKHIAVIGSTGSGKSHTLATIIQKAVAEKKKGYKLNNSHVIIFDIHSEYRSAFPDANIVDVNNLVLPYWLLNSEEFEEILLDTGERDNYNQTSIFRTLVTENKKKHNSGKTVFYDSPLFFDIHEVKNALINLKNETVNSKAAERYMIVDSSYALLAEGKTDVNSGLKLNEKERLAKYFEKELDFHPTKAQSITGGVYADGTLDKFAVRFAANIAQERLDFLFGKKSKTISFEDTLKQLIGYKVGAETNVTVVDLSGVPFEVLSITVSLISRLLFEYGYFHKRLRCSRNAEEKVNNDVPLLLVYEEAHKYVPNSDLSKYRSSRKSIERIAKEGRKYGITLLLASQRPSEISETIFSQCNNFIAMRLTNPKDQSFVDKLLPDTLGNLTDTLPVLKAGEALLIGESVILPSIIKIDKCEQPPSSSDIPYWELWKEKWKELDIEAIKKEWLK